MSVSKLTAGQIKQVTALLDQELTPQLIYLFGSAAREELRPDSDVDLAFLSERSRGNYEVFLVAQQLADLLRREVDLIDLRNASTVLKAQIVAYGKNIYACDDNRRTDFEIMVLKEYALLNEERQVVIDRFVKDVNPDVQ
jgi:predicted nucleotidyltransferase